ncbi:MAG: poly(R)-hydroxyalkanoic acid synthase subunit PhaE [Desulfobacteraceae bacterium]|jgi:hypothetical protein
METPFTMPGLKEMMDQFSNVQKNNYESFKQNMNSFMGDKNPMNMFFTDKMSDNALVSVFSEAMDLMRNTTQGMIDISAMLMPGLDGSGQANPEEFFKKHIPGLPARIMKKLLEIPPVGITRPYQEKINMALDKMAMFNSATMDFLYCSMLPVEEATLFTFREIAKQSETLKSPEDVQKVYNLWIKALEKEYQDLFKTDRYKGVIAKIFSTMAEFRGAYRELVLDLIQLAGLPFGREVDELCKDVIAMKRKMKEFESQLKKMTDKAEL